MAQGLEARGADLYAENRKRRLRIIKMYKAWIVVLVLCLVGGVAKGASVRPIPVFPMLVGIAMNLLITLALVLTIRKLERTSKNITEY